MRRAIISSWTLPELQQGGHHGGHGHQFRWPERLPHPGVTVSGNTLQQWRRENFSAAESADPAMEATMGGGAANPGDLWSNTFEFFFGTDPNSFEAHCINTCEVEEKDSEALLVLEFQRSTAMPAGTGVVEISGVLAQWQVVNTPAMVVEDLGDREPSRVSNPLEPEQARQRCMRLVVDLGEK